MIGFILVLVLVMALVMGDMDGATGSYTPNPFLLWVALALIAAWVLGVG